MRGTALCAVELSHSCWSRLVACRAACSADAPDTCAAGLTIVGISLSVGQLTILVSHLLEPFVAHTGQGTSCVQALHLLAPDLNPNQNGTKHTGEAASCRKVGANSWSRTCTSTSWAWPKSLPETSTQPPNEQSANLLSDQQYAITMQAHLHKHQPATDYQTQKQPTPDLNVNASSPAQRASPVGWGQPVL